VVGLKGPGFLQSGSVFMIEIIGPFRCWNGVHDVGPVRPAVDCGIHAMFCLNAAITSSRALCTVHIVF
jgi:hypothetical protein